VKGKLKNGEFHIGHRNAFNKVTGGKEMKITDYEDHPIWGKRYKIYGFNEWFEENCFEYVKKD
jgi:hypothetical protein